MFVSSTRWTFLLLFLIAGKVLADTNYNSILNIQEPEVCSARTTRHFISLDQHSVLIRLEDLLPGASYHLFTLPALGDKYCLPVARTTTPGDELKLIEPGIYHFQATTSSLEMRITGLECQTDQLISLSIGKVTQQESTSGILSASSGGIEIDLNTYTVEELIETVFIGGDCFQVEMGSIRYEGSEESIGFFSNGVDALNVEEGIILSTGKVKGAEGPNERYNTGNWLSGSADDADLEQLLDNNYKLRDRASLEFDFTPTSEMISFDFVFASEEYCEYVNSNFNDVFGFFISGPGINGPFSDNGENIAFVPGSNDYISINSVNHFQNQLYFNNNMPLSQHDDLPFFSSCPELENDPGVASAFLEYDGFTSVMTATAQVIPCETYHIRLVVSDVQDGYYDSAVFLKANSFSGGNTAQISVNVPGFGGDQITEDCTEGYFRFDRTNEDLSEEVVIRYTVSELSTATAGIDYEAFPDSIIIPAGEAFYNLPILAYNDDLVEGIEKILLEMEVPCSCENPYSAIYLRDGDPLVAEDTEILFCDGQAGLVSANTTGGIGAVSYLWSTGDTLAELPVLTTQNTDYSVTITDQCGKSVSAMHRVIITPQPTATLSGETFLCENIAVNTLPVSLTGTGPWNLEYTLNNIPQDPVIGILNDNFKLPVTSVGTYQITAIHDHTCIGIPAGSGTVDLITLDLTETMKPLTCPGANDGVLMVTPTGGDLPYNFNWDTGAVGMTASSLDSGRYQVTLSDANGCETIRDFPVILDPEVPQVAIAPGKILTCDTTEIILSATASTGSIYEYLWKTDTGNVLYGTTSLTPTVSEPGDYVLEVLNNSSGCRRMDTLTVMRDITPPDPIVLILGPQTLTCNETATILDATTSGPFGEVVFTWSTEDGYLDPAYINHPVPEIDSAGLYQLLLTNTTNGCTSSLSTLIDLNMTVPSPIIAAPAPLTCRDTLRQLDATASVTQGIPIFNWTTLDGNLLTGTNGPTPEIAAPGIYQLNIIDTENGCSNTALLEATENRIAPVAMILPVTEMLDCNTPEISLSATGILLENYRYEWGTPDGNIISSINTENILVAAAGSYKLVVTDTENGCTNEAIEWVEANENRPLNIMIETQKPDCYGEAGGLDILGVTGGEGPYLFSINLFSEEVFYSDTSYRNLTPGEFEITVQDINGCKLSQLVTVDNVPELVVSTEPLYEIRLGESQELRASVNVPDFRIDSIIWKPGSEILCENCYDPVVRPFEDTYYTVSVIDEKGCTATAQTLVAVDTERRVYIPNAFSPNGDGQNETITVFTDLFSVRRVNTFQVFSRWGEKLFENTNFQPNLTGAGWDGFFGNERMMPGVYVYFAEVEFVDGHREVYKGDVTLLR